MANDISANSSGKEGADMSLWETILMRLFLWSGSKLFSHVAVFAPDGDDGVVKAVHFALNERTLLESCRELVADEEA
ncbi:MAG: hypothetical protein HY300_19765 [Verrucomicrobia bacterium]|nr:hypothetical protein [Verrucomicrobiota bacterium]